MGSIFWGLSFFLNPVLDLDVVFWEDWETSNWVLVLCERCGDFYLRRKVVLI